MFKHYKASIFSRPHDTMKSSKNLNENQRSTNMTLQNIKLPYSNIHTLNTTDYILCLHT